MICAIIRLELCQITRTYYILIMEEFWDFSWQWSVACRYELNLKIVFTDHANMIRYTFSKFRTEMLDDFIILIKLNYKAISFTVSIFLSVKNPCVIPCTFLESPSKKNISMHLFSSILLWRWVLIRFS